MIAGIADLRSFIRQTRLWRGFSPPSPLSHRALQEHWRRAFGGTDIVSPEFLLEQLDDLGSHLRLRTKAKGEPDRDEIIDRCCRDVSARVRSGELDRDDGTTLRLAKHLASLHVAHPAGMALATGVFCRRNAAVLEQLRASLSRHVMLHVSCVPRLDRAQASIDSFAARSDDPLSHVVIVGTDRSDGNVEFDPVRRVVGLPIRDCYEALPEKVFAAASLMALVPQVEVVVKVDDDLRAGDIALAQRTLARTGRTVAPLQVGVPATLGFYGQNSRLWHFGKCRDKQLGVAPFEQFGSVRWMRGAHGYMLNRAALRLMYWADLYFGAYVENALYEDVAVSDALERLGARMRTADLQRMFPSVTDY